MKKASFTPLFIHSLTHSSIHSLKPTTLGLCQLNSLPTLNFLKTDSLVYKKHMNSFRLGNEWMEKQPQDFDGGSQSRFKKKNIFHCIQNKNEK